MCRPWQNPPERRFDLSGIRCQGLRLSDVVQAEGESIRRLALRTGTRSNLWFVDTELDQAGDIEIVVANVADLAQICRYSFVAISEN